VSVCGTVVAFNHSPIDGFADIFRRANTVLVETPHADAEKATHSIALIKPGERYRIATVRHTVAP
jgi:hypothetical protein